jgi:hypothetical protein
LSSYRKSSKVIDGKDLDTKPSMYLLTALGAMLSRAIFRTEAAAKPPRKHVSLVRQSCFRGGNSWSYPSDSGRESMAPGARSYPNSLKSMAALCSSPVSWSHQYTASKNWGASCRSRNTNLSPQPLSPIANAPVGKLLHSHALAVSLITSLQVRASLFLSVVSKIGYRVKPSRPTQTSPPFARHIRTT